MSLKPICMPCQRFFRIRKSGFYFTEGMPVGTTRPVSGTAHPEQWKPYKIWSGDVWQCEGCGAKIISGFGLRPLAERHDPDFESWRRHRADQFQVNDC